MRLLMSASALAVTIATPSFAELTAGQLWDEWQAALGEVGELRWDGLIRGDRDIAISGLEFTVRDGEDLVLTLPQVNLTETQAGVVVQVPSDGTVRVLDGRIEPAEQFRAALIISGAELTIEDGAPRNYAFSIPELGLRDWVARDTERDEMRPLDALALWQGVQGRWSVDLGDGGNDPVVNLGLLTGPLQFNLQAEDFGEMDMLDVNVSLEDLTIAGFFEGWFDPFAPTSEFVTWDFVTDIGTFAARGDFATRADESGLREAEGFIDFQLAGYELSSSARMPKNIEAAVMERMGVPQGAQGSIMLRHEGYEVSFDVTEAHNWWGEYRSQNEGKIVANETAFSASLDETGDLSLLASGSGSWQQRGATSDVNDNISREDEMMFSVERFAANAEYFVPLSRISSNPLALFDDVRVVASYELAGVEAMYDETVAYGDETPTDNDIRFSLNEASSGISLADNAFRVQVGIDAADLAGTVERTGDIEGSLRNFELDANSPLITNGAPMPYDVRLFLESLSMGDGTWDLFDPDALFDRGVISANINMGGLLSTNPLVLMSLAMTGEGVPIDVKNVDFDVVFDGFGLGVRGDGAFDTTDLISFGEYPEGRAQFVYDGIERFFDNIRALGGMTASEREESQFFIDTFTVPGSEEGQRTMEVELTPEAHVIINGVRMQ